MFTALVLAASMTIGQAENVPAEKPEYDPNLEPIAWLIGNWTSDQYKATGELMHTVKATYTWKAGGKAMLLEKTAAKPDGTPSWSEIYVFYWDASQKRICRYGFGSMGYVTQDTLMKKDDTGLLFEQRWVYTNGNQGYYHFKIGCKPGDLDSFTKGWSRISGTGSADIGPFEFKRVK